MTTRSTRTAAFSGLTLSMGLATAALLGGCTPPPPPSPEVQALEHQYQMGCRPEDSQGYEHMLQYCGKGDGGGNRN